MIFLHSFQKSVYDDEHSATYLSTTQQQLFLIAAATGKHMATELAQMIAADLAQIRGNLPRPDAVAAQDDEVPAASGFAGRMRDALHGVNQQDHDAAEQMAAVDSGRSDDLVGAMLSSQQAGLSFSMLMQVRNKVMGAVDELVKLPL
jgi:flagellar hook-basal body complex protein FliE